MLGLCHGEPGAVVSHAVKVDEPWLAIICLLLHLLFLSLPLSPVTVLPYCP